MRRPVIFILFGFLGFLLALVAALPPARSAGTAPAFTEVPVEWLAKAMSGRPFFPPS
jgi:hypothetical protein